MDKEELLIELKNGIRARFMELDEVEKDLIRANSGTPYSVAIRKVIGEDLLSGLRSGEPQGIVKNKRGLGTR
tara:strand:+ start:291 stop:506 length:216 start_codon:yes stop_codon:yes gene_type:complete